MLDPRSYPRNIVWFVQADDGERDDDGEPSSDSQVDDQASEGSAVAIRLKRNDVQGPPQVYLLTCAHVVRQPGDGPSQFGPCYSRIRAWQPSWGYSSEDPTSGTLVSPVSDVLPTTTEVSEFYANPVQLEGHADWVLLQFADKKISEDQRRPVLQSWSDPTTADLRDARTCHVVGYPGGAAGFSPPGRIVEPSIPFEDTAFQREDDGLISLQGTGTRAGMSGGGIFDVESGELVGLHRSRDDLTLNLRGVSIHQIQTVLAANFTFQPPPKRFHWSGDWWRVWRWRDGWSAASKLAKCLATIGVALTLVLAIVGAMWYAFRSVTIEDVQLADPEKLGAIGESAGDVLPEFHRTFGQTVFIVTTTAFPRKMDAREYVLQSSDQRVRFQVIGVVEDSVGNKLAGKLIVTPREAGNPVTLTPERPKVTSKQRMRLLVGVIRPDKLWETDDLFEEHLQASLSLSERRP